MMVLNSFLFLCLVSAAFGLPNLLDLMKSHNGTQFANLIQQAGLADLVNQQGPFTILVPTDAAFAKLKPGELAKYTSDPNKLAELIKYHMLNGEEFSWDLGTGHIMKSVNNHALRPYQNRFGHTIHINQAGVVQPDIEGSNGIIYLIDELLNVPEGTITQIVESKQYNLTHCAELLKAAHREGTFNHTTASRYTLFCPADHAFEAVNQHWLQTTEHSYSRAAQLLNYHMHLGTVHSKSLTSGTRLSTMYRGHYIMVSTPDQSGDARLNQVALLEISDIEADNGVVHVISHILIPSSWESGIIG